MRENILNKLPKKNYKVNVDEKHSVTKLENVGDKVQMFIKTVNARDLLELKQQKERQRMLETLDVDGWQTHEASRINELHLEIVNSATHDYIDDKLKVLKNRRKIVRIKTTSTTLNMDIDDLNAQHIVKNQ